MPRKSPNKRATTPNRILALEKQRRALELRKAGADYQTIATRVGYNSPQAASNSVRRAVNAIPMEEARELKTLNLERLNQWMLVIWPKTLTGDENAIRLGLNIMDKIDRLVGTEAATRMEVTAQVDAKVGGVLVIDGATEDYMEQLRKMAAAGGMTPLPRHDQSALPTAETLKDDEPIDVKVKHEGIPDDDEEIEVADVDAYGEPSEFADLEAGLDEGIVPPAPTSTNGSNPQDSPQPVENPQPVCSYYLRPRNSSGLCVRCGNPKEDHG